MANVNALGIVVLSFSLCFQALGASSALAEGRGLSAERLSMAKGHYARAQSLLAAALREFDKGAEIASADRVLDSREWRKGVANHAEDLTPLIDPQPRASRGGVRYEPDTRLHNTGKGAKKKKVVDEEAPLGS